MGRPRKFPTTETIVRKAIKTKCASKKGKKRVFCGNQFTLQKLSAAVTASTTQASNSITTSDEPTTSTAQSPSTRSLSKLKDYAVVVPEDETLSVSSLITGNRIIDMDIFSNLIGLFACPVCKDTCLEISESFKYVLATKLKVKCSTLVCLWEHSFWTSKKLASKLHCLVVLISIKGG